MGFIETHKAECMISVLINTHMLMAARDAECRPLLLLVLGVRLRRGQADAARRGAAARKTTPIRPCRRTATAGRSCSASGCAAISARTSASRRASPATTTSTVRTAPTTAAARRRRPRSVARSSRRSSAGDDEIEVWGDGEQTRSFMYIDDCLHGTRTLMHERRARADQHRQRRARHDQPADRHRRGDRRPAVQAALQPRRAERCARPLQRQHAHQAEARVGAVDPAARRSREDLPLDSRPDGDARRQAPRATPDRPDS